MTNQTPSTLFTGDNLDILSGLDSESVDLIYLDPPFNSKRMYSAPMGSKAAGASFKDMWTWSDVDEARLEYLFDKYPALANYIQSISELHGKPMMAYVTYMTQRLIELHRVLKSTGSLYLHCDPTASHYLKQILDGIFGDERFNNELVWRRTTGGKTVSRKYPANTDTVLFYTKTSAYNFEPTKIPLSGKDLLEYKKDDNDGRGLYCTKDLQKPGSPSPNQLYDYTCNDGFLWSCPKKGWRLVEGRMRELDNDNRLYKGGRTLREKYYAEERKLVGKQKDNFWDDIPIASRKESTGYPTQKPLKLMHRIIEASSSEGDIVLDPFCGCATTCVAAEELKRKWIGIDIAEQAADLVLDRLTDMGIFTHNTYIHRTDVPHRTDLTYEEPTGADIRPFLFKEQGGHCNGCNTEFEIQHFEVDHIIPRAKGGGNYIENYQLLCGNCNRVKGARPMEYLMAKLQARRDAKAKLTFGV